MKAKQETIENIAKLTRTYLEKMGLQDTLEQVREREKAGTLTDATRWALWHAVTDEIRFTDDHSRFNGRKRVLHHDFNFPLYPDGTNDTTMTTALRAAYKNL